MNDLQIALIESHKDLKQWFLMHQECLLLGDDSCAADAFNGFYTYLREHLQFENTHLLLGDKPLRWSLKVYKKEHDKLLLMAEKADKQLTSFYGMSGRKKRLALLVVLERQSTFMHVLEHHEEREEQDLFLHIPDDSELFQQWQIVECKLNELDAVKLRLKTRLND